MKNVVLAVLDGFGIAPPGPGNAVYLANPTNINSYFSSFPNTQLGASGETVGLPHNEVGNTEVGHINLGAGRVVYQDLPRINLSIADGTFYKNSALAKVITHLKATGGKLHLLGLLSEGTVHSNVEHLFALLHFAKLNQLDKVFVHSITDGRDSPPKSASEIVKRVEEKIKELGIGRIATVIGRYFAMDRDRRWDRTEKAYRCLTQGEGQKAKSAQEAIENAYSQNKTDEFIDPTVIIESSLPVALIEAGDAVIFYNFRIDRPRELTKVFVLDNFEQDANKITSFDPYAVKYHKTHYPQEQILAAPFKRGGKIQNLAFITMTEYEKGLPVDVAYPPTQVKLPLSRVLSEQGLAQLKITESEKERFVTYYFNGLKEAPFPQEERIIVPSPKVQTYDQKPEMSAYEITEILIKKIYEQRHSFILVNFANADMVGHTGNIEASVKAVKVLDECIAKISDATLDKEDYLIIISDHGNVEQKINPQTGQISTEHTANPVPFIVVAEEFQGRLIKLQTGILADVSPTVLFLLNLDKPTEMTGRNLLEEFKRS